MGKRRKDRFFVYLPCKPYVKRYLIHNFGVSDPDWPDAVSLSSDPFLYQRFRASLNRASNRYDSRYKELSRYSNKVQIEIKKDDFYRYGWALTETEVVSLCGLFEAKVKSMMCTYLDIHRSLGIPLATAIRNFQKKFDFPEDIWSADTIRREYNRNGTKGSIGIIDDFFTTINQILMVNLSRTGTISQQGIKAYE